MRVVGRLRSGLGWVDEGEKISEEIWPLIDVGAEEEKREGVGKLVTQD